MDHEKIEDRQDLFEDIDYSNVNKILEKEKKRSLSWLINALNDNSSINTSASDDMIESVFNLLEEVINKNNINLYYKNSDSINKLRQELEKIHFPNINNQFINENKNIKLIFVSNNIIKLNFIMIYYKLLSKICIGKKETSIENIINQ